MHLKYIPLFILGFIFNFSLEAKIAFWQKQDYKFLFANSAQSLPQYACSTYVQINTRTPNNASYNVPSNLTVNITPVPNVKFYSDPSCTTEITSFVVSSGTSSNYFYFSSSDTNPVQITVSATNYVTQSQTQTITANNFIWTGASGNGLWNDASNWSNNQVPGSSNLAVFNSTCGANCNVTINSNINVAGIKMDTDYTGTITQDAANTITLGSRRWLMKGGNFVGGSGNITMSSGLYLESGTFTATSSNLQVTGNIFQYSLFIKTGTTFNHNNGNFILNNYTMSSMAVSNLQLNNNTFNNFEISGHGMISNNGSMTVLGNFKLSLSSYAANIYNGTFYLKGNVEIVAFENYLISTTSVSLTLFELNGTGDQTITTDATENASGTQTTRITINKPSGNVNVTGSLTTRELKILSGNLLMNPNTTLTLKGYNPSSATVHQLNGGTFSNIYFFGSRPQELSGTAICDNLKIDIGSFYARIQGGTLYVKKDVTMIYDENYSGQSNLRIELIDSNPSNISMSSTRLPGTVVVNKSTQATAVNLTSNVVINGNSSDLIVQSGTINMNGYNLSVGSSSGTDNTLTLESGTTINRGGGTLTYEAITNNGGTINP